MFVSISNGTDAWLGRLALPFLPRLALACWLSSCHSLGSPFSCLKTPGPPSKGLPYVTITIAWAEHCDSITCSHYAGLPAPWGQEKPGLLLPSIQHSAPAHQRCSKHMSRMNKLLVWITEWARVSQGRTLHPVRSIPRSRPTLSVLLFEKFQDDPSVTFQ